MNIKRFPIWARWSFLVAALWVAWGIAVRPQFAKRIGVADKQHCDCDRQLIAVQDRIGQAPMLIRGVDSCRHVLDSCLASFASSRNLDELASRLRDAGKRHGLADLQAEPELRDLLKASRAAGTSQSTPIRLDTIVVTLSARGGFMALGAWLDEIERRPDFQTWISCGWHRADEDEGVGFEGKAILLVLGGSELNGTGRTAGM